MKINKVGLSKSDLLEVHNLLEAHVDTLKDGNGAPPPVEVEGQSNPDYVYYVQITRLKQSVLLFYDQAVFYDTDNATDTDPAAVLSGTVGTF